MEVIGMSCSVLRRGKKKVLGMSDKMIDACFGEQMRKREACLRFSIQVKISPQD